MATEIAKALRALITERQLEGKLARGEAPDVRQLEHELRARLAHAPPPAVMTAVAEEVARLQEARREAWLRAERARRSPRPAQVDPSRAASRDDGVGGPLEREAHGHAAAFTRRVLVAVDGSESSLRAVDFAVSQCARVGADLDLVSVVEDPAAAHVVGAGVYLPSAYEEARFEALHRAVARVPRPGPRVHERMLYGHPITVLLHEVHEPGVELLVVGRRGKRDPTAPHPGSVSQAVVASAPVPVVVVP